MNLLIAAATSLEISPTHDFLLKNNELLSGHEQGILITGVGGVLTAYSLMRKFTTRRPDLVIQAGIAGSFEPGLKPGAVVMVNEEVFADLGATEAGTLKDVFDLGLLNGNTPPFTNGSLTNPRMEEWKKFNLPSVRSASVNAISSSPAQVEAIEQKYKPAIESMEGGAFHYVCLMEKIPFIQLRAISNFTGDRNKDNWKMTSAIGNLNTELIAIITALCSST